MLQPKEADVPALFLLLVVLPLVTYVLLGIWNEAVKKKARISMLAQLAAEEACRVEAMSSGAAILIVPSSRTGFHECARCFAPATTRCSRCKSIRYCSGKCQIIHWRQGHKEECQKWHDSALNVSVGQKSLDNLKSSLHENDSEDSLRNDLLGELSDDPCLVTTDTSQDSEYGIKQSGKRMLNKLKKVKFRSDDPAVYTVGQFCSDVASTQASSKDNSLGHKLGTGNYLSFNEMYRDQYDYSLIAQNVMHQPNKLAGEARNELKQSGSSSTSKMLHLDKHVITESENDTNITLKNIDSHKSEVSSANETVETSYSSRNISAKGDIMYKKPPYTFGQPSSLQQKLAENLAVEYPSQRIERNAYKETESRVPQSDTSTGNQNTEGTITVSKKTSKVLRRSLVGLINENKKNKICQVLFPYEDLVKFFQCEVWGISPRGLLNCGNSCYANAVLQCLTCTKPLMVYLLQRSHSRNCCVKDWCLMCELEQHVSMLREGGGPLSPNRILSNMRNIGCRMGGGDQEDAHEFLRLLVMSMQSRCLEGLGCEKEIDPRVQETTLIQQIFGGRLKSKVKCLRCHLESERYENIMDLTLEIHGWVESLEDALTQYTAPEDLDGENKYRCGRCSAYVQARKQLSLHEVPNILTIVLKRFQTGKYGKINKCVTFPDMLDMIPFVTGMADTPPLYLLYAVVVHLDSFNASFSGHYISYVKDLQGTWFRIDDSEVQAVPLSQVMSEGAYMLFYSRTFPRPPRAYLEKPPFQDPTCTRQNTAKTQKASKHGQQKQTEILHPLENSVHLRNYCRPEYWHDIEGQAAEHFLRSSSRNVLPAEISYSDSLSMDFSDATSSDLSLFTSSDESSFTTESTRDSFSTVDYGDNASLDALSSIFSPYYVPGYSSNNTVSCTKLTPCRPQTRFYSESIGCFMDPSMPTQPLGNVHKGRNLEQARAASTEPFKLASSCNLYGRYGSNPKDNIVQTSGFCGM